MTSKVIIITITINSKFIITLKTIPNIIEWNVNFFEDLHRTVVAFNFFEK